MRARYDNDIAKELNKMTKKTAIQLKDRAFNVKDSVSIIVFVQDFKAACDAVKFQKRTAMWLFMRYLKARIKSVINAYVTL